MDGAQWSTTANGSRIHKTVRLVNPAHIKPGPRCDIRLGVSLDASFGRITLGSDCLLNEGAALEAASTDGLSLGDRVRVGEGALVRARFVGNDVVIGQGAVVLDGAVLLDFAVVPDGAEVPTGAIVHGRSDTAACVLAAAAATGLLAPAAAASAAGCLPPAAPVTLAGAVSHSCAGASGFAVPLAWAHTTPPSL